MAGSVYLDHQATTPTDPRVVDAMLPYFGERFGNPHSHHHGIGHAAEKAVERARRQVADPIGAEPREIVFTSGATEANNMAIKGAARFQRARNGRHRVITCVIEHKCVLESARRLQDEGFEVVFLPVRPNGIVDPKAAARVIDEKTAVVSVMAANNEIGVLQPIAEIGALCREKGALFHTDAAQAIGKIPLDLRRLPVDLLSLSGHKMYGPMGIGALYLRRRPRARIQPLFDGGGQERGVRSGTLPTPLCVGLGTACEIAAAEMAREPARLRALRERLLSGLRERVPGVVVNGDPEARLPGNLNLAFPGIDGEALMAALPDLALSSGSACSSAALQPSYVLKALGLDSERAQGSLRIGLGRSTTEADVDTAIRRIAEEARRLRDG